MRRASVVLLLKPLYGASNEWMIICIALDYFDCAPDSVQQDRFWDRQAAGVFFRDRQPIADFNRAAPLTPDAGRAR